MPLDARGANKNRRAPPHRRPPICRRACPLLRRYASLYFLACVDDDDNELIVLETIHHFVEVLDRYFGNVCELDLIFNFHKARNARRRDCMGQQSVGRGVCRVVCARFSPQACE